eukprot:GHVO01046551.1.p1 GENE.GHVO01046551.1~~GHVO01046551.1.p1  ORF type:complete len:118 (-),score=11.48 GHVO01046551.1:223-576(-)
MDIDADHLSLSAFEIGSLAVAVEPPTPPTDEIVLTVPPSSEAVARGAGEMMRMYPIQPPSYEETINSSEPPPPYEQVMGPSAPGHDPAAYARSKYSCTIHFAGYIVILLLLSTLTLL